MELVSMFWNPLGTETREYLRTSSFRADDCYGGDDDTQNNNDQKPNDHVTKG